MLRHILSLDTQSAHYEMQTRLSCANHLANIQRRLIFWCRWSLGVLFLLACYATLLCSRQWFCVLRLCPCPRLHAGAYAGQRLHLWRFLAIRILRDPISTPGSFGLATLPFTFKYPYEALILQHYEHVRCIHSGDGRSTECVGNGQTVLEEADIGVLDKWACVGILAGFQLLYRFMFYAVLQVRIHYNRF